MKIILSRTFGFPGQAETVLSVSGDTITVDGIDYDLSAVSEGGEAIPEGDDHPFTGKITRQDGILTCTVSVILGPDAADNQPADLAHRTVTVTSGPVAIPAIRKSVEAAE